MAKVRMAFAFFCAIIKAQKYNRRMAIYESGNTDSSGSIFKPEY